MARKKSLTLEEVTELAERVQDLAIDVSHAADRIDVMHGEIASAAAVKKFHQMTVASAEMSRMLLAILGHREDMANLERDLRAKTATDAA